MNIIFLLLPLSIILGLVFLAGYIWSVCNKQYEDLNTPALRMLVDDDTNFKLEEVVMSKSVVCDPKTDSCLLNRES